jgi:hypothetical protein
MIDEVILALLIIIGAEAIAWTVWGVYSQYHPVRQNTEV